MSSMEIVYGAGLLGQGCEEWTRREYRTQERALAEALEWAAARLRDDRRVDAVLISLINKRDGKVVSFNPRWMAIPLQG